MSALNKKSKHQMKLLVASSLFGDLGSGIFSFGLSFMLLDKTGSIYSFAISSIASPIIGLLLLPIIGSTSDKYSKKRVILISQIVSIISLILYFFSIQRFNNILVLTIFLIVILRISDQFTITARLSSHSQLVLPEDLQPLTAYTQVAQSFSSIISATFGALFYSLMPFHIFLLLEVIAEFATVIIIIRLNFNLSSIGNEIREVNEIKSLVLFKEGLIYIASEKFLLFGILIALSINLFNGIFSIGLPSLLITNLGFSNLFYSFVEGVSGVGVIVASLVIRKININYPMHITFVFSLIIGAIIAFIGIFSFVLPSMSIVLKIIIFLLLFLIGISYTFLNIPYTVWLQKNIPTYIQGRVFSTLNILGLGIAPIGVYLFGIVFKMLQDPAILFFISGIIMIIINYLIKVYFKLDLKQAKIKN